MKKSIKILIVVLLIGQLPLTTYAWGEIGHRLIVEMAIALLKPAAHQRVMAILNGYPIDDAAVWMDSVRENKKTLPQWKFMEEWHFLNMDSNRTYAEVASPDDVVFRLDEVMRQLQHPETISPDSLPIKLRVLFHLMGDITQPLHVGYASDGGGNSIPVRTAGFNETGNELHAVWDKIIITEGKINLQSSLAYYHGLDQDKLHAIVAGSTQDWMMQARSYLVPDVYNYPPAQHGVVSLSVAYLDSNVPIVQQQIVYAAVRLANVLNADFGG